MKKSLFPLLFLTISFSLFSASYKSNALGQKLELVDTLMGVGWEKTEEEGTHTLYLDGVVQSTRIEYSDGYEVVEENQSERVFLDSEGKIIRKIITTEAGVKEYNYFYDGKRLISYTYSENDELIKKVDYIFTSSTLASISGSNKGFFLSEYYVYDDETGASVIENLVPDEDTTVLERGEYETLDNGMLKEERDGRTYYYDSSGRLSSETGEDYTLNYFYSQDGSLEQTEKLQGINKEVVVYQGNEGIKTIYYEQEEIKKEQTVLDSGEIEEIRYISGTPRYRVLFDIDGKRIKEIVAL